MQESGVCAGGEAAFSFRYEQLNSAAAEIQVVLNRSSRSSKFFNE